MAVSMGLGHVAAVCQDGSVFLWGDNTEGQCGVAEPATIPEPRILDRHIFGARKPSAVSCGNTHCVIVTEDGAAYSFGNGAFGKLAVGDAKQHASPVEMKVSGVTSTACNATSTVFVDQEGVLISGGHHIGCRPRLVPERISMPEQICNVSAGASHYGAVSFVGSLFVWGNNDNGQLGQGDFKARIEPTVVSPPEYSKRCHKVSCGAHHTAMIFVIRNRLEVFVCGDGQHGQLGAEGAGFNPRLRQLEMKLLVRDVTAGDTFSALLFEDNTVLVLGDGLGEGFGLAGDVVAAGCSQHSFTCCNLPEPPTPSRGHEDEETDDHFVSKLQSSASSSQLALVTNKGALALYPSGGSSPAMPNFTFLDNLRINCQDLLAGRREEAQRRGITMKLLFRLNEYSVQKAALDHDAIVLCEMKTYGNEYDAHMKQLSKFKGQAVMKGEFDKADEHLQEINRQRETFLLRWNASAEVFLLLLMSDAFAEGKDIAVKKAQEQFYAKKALAAGLSDSTDSNAQPPLRDEPQTSVVVSVIQEAWSSKGDELLVWGKRLVQELAAAQQTAVQEENYKKAHSIQSFSEMFMSQ